MKTTTKTLTFAALVLAASQASAQMAVFSGSGEAAEGRSVPIIREGKPLHPGEIESIDVLTELPAADSPQSLKPLERVITVPGAGGKGGRRFKVCWGAEGGESGSSSSRSSGSGSIRGARIVAEKGEESLDQSEESPDMLDALPDAEYRVEGGSTRRLPDGEASVILELRVRRGAEDVRVRVQITGGGEARLLPLEAR